MATSVPCRRFWPLVSFWLVCAGISPGATGDAPEFTYHSNVTEVRLTFSATDQNNHGVATLQAKDFAVVDKGFIVRDFQSFTRSDWTKLEIAILVDASESVGPRFRQEVAAALELVSQTDGVPDENLSIFSFQGLEPALVCAGTCRASHAAERLPVARAGGLTPLFDAIVFSSDFLSKQGDDHTDKVLILFSDGEDTISRSSLRDAVDTALNKGVQIYGIDLSHVCASQGGAILQSLSTATGGRYFGPRTEAREAMNVILEGFRANYIVSYRLPSRGFGFHDVRILPTHNLNLQFRSRSGYYYPNQIR